MSTRATYGFIERKWKSTVYIHWDGYPQGAACYFWKMLVNPSKGNAATQFIRANDDAELTESHDCHGDTEFRYDLQGHGPDAILTCSAASFDSEDENRWRVFFFGTLSSFLDRHKDFLNDHGFDYDEFRPVGSSYSTKILNKHTAKLELYKKHGPVSHLKMWKGRFEGSSNWNSQMATLKSIIAEFPSLIDDEISEILANSPH